MDEREIEGRAHNAWTRSGIDPGSPGAIIRLAEWAGLEVAGCHPFIFAGDGRLDNRRILVRSGIPRVRLRWAVAHELAEANLRALDYRGPDVEQVADRMAAALLAPWDRVRDLGGESVPELARDLGLSQVAAALRQGEVLRVPLVAVGRRVRARGPAEWAWPEEQELRRLAKCRQLPPGLEREEIEGAVLIRAEVG